MKTKRKPKSKTLGMRVQHLEADLKIIEHNFTEEIKILRNREALVQLQSREPKGLCPFGARTPALNSWVARDPAAVNHGQPWTPGHVDYVLRSHDQGMTVPSIARALGRTSFAVFCKLLKEGNQFDAMKRNALTEDNVYSVMAEIAVAKGLVKWA